MMVYGLKWIFATHFKVTLVEKEKKCHLGALHLSPKKNQPLNQITKKSQIIDQQSQSQPLSHSFIHSFVFFFGGSSLVSLKCIWIILHVKCILERRVQGLGYPQLHFMCHNPRLFSVARLLYTWACACCYPFPYHQACSVYLLIPFLATMGNSYDYMPGPLPSSMLYLA